MVKDVLANASRYSALGPYIATALAHAATTDFSSWAAGEYEIEGRHVRVQVQHYTTKPPSEGRWEAHRRHIDLQMVARGEEHIGVAPLGSLAAEPYDEDKDLLWLQGAGDVVTLRPGDFVLLWPEDGHMPGLQLDGPSQVIKAVYKIRLEG
jgi:YhcH/YjgK/YiaL family protein